MTEIVPSRSSAEKEHSSHSGENINRRRRSSVSPGRHQAQTQNLHLHSHTPHAENDDIGFQMRPNAGEKFNHVEVESLIESIIREYMVGKQYSTEEAENWAKELANTILSKVKALNFPRYKLVATVTLGEQIGGGIHIGMKCLWDADTDIYANFNYTTDKIFVIGTICGIFYY